MQKNHRVINLIFFIVFFIPLLAFSKTNALTPPLPVDQAFQLFATAANNETIIVRFKIAKGYYLYRHRMHFAVIKPHGVHLGQPLLPIGIVKKNSEIGDYEVYANNLTIPIPVIAPKKPDILLQVHYQGCAQSGFCYPPSVKIVPIDLSGDYNIYKNAIAIDVSPNESTTPTSPQDKIHLLFENDNFWLFILSFLGIGFLISLTPCVLPMIPILSGIILGQGKISTSRSLILSLAYVLGMAITYAMVGIIFGVIGENLQAAFQKPLIISVLSLIFVFMALSLFGFYTLQLPEKWRHSFAQAGEHQKHGTLIGTFFMGCLSTLVLSPCVTPALVGVLGYISHTGNAVLGGVALFTLSIGMGIPLLIIGATSAKYLPKSGPWMNAIKSVLGIMLLGVAIWMLARILPGPITLLLWGILAIGTALYLGALKSATSLLTRLLKGLGLAIFIYGIILIIGAAAGNSNPLKPISLAAFSHTTHINSLKFIRVKTISDIKKQLDIAHRENKPVLLDFYADWCIACKAMDRQTFSNPAVVKQLKNFILLRADVTKNDIENKTLERHFQVIAPPTLLFFNIDKKEIHSGRIVGEMNARTFLKHLKTISHALYQKTV